MKTWSKHALAIVLAALCVSADAMAATVTTRFAGYTIGGYDDLGLFGPAGASLDGLRWAARYTYDTSLGQRSYDTILNEDTLIGGTSVGSSSIVSAVSITINGITRSLITGYIESIYSRNGYRQYLSYNDYFAGNVETFNSLIVEVENSSIPFSLDSIFGTIPSNTVSSGGGGITFSECPGSTNCVYTNTAFRNRINFATSEVPEPATWAMLIAGLGFTGVTMRQRRILRG